MFYTSPFMYNYETHVNHHFGRETEISVRKKLFGPTEPKIINQKRPKSAWTDKKLSKDRNLIIS